MSFPPLPKITSEQIQLQVYTHRSVFGRPGHQFEDSPTDPAPDNESLEHLGDSVLGFIITNLIRKIYPFIRVGPATKIRSIVVGNPTLAALTVGYKLHGSLQAHPAQIIVLRNSANIQADLFESYVAGVYLTRGLEVTAEWISVLFLPLIEQAYNDVRAQYYILPDTSSPSHSPGSSTPVELLSASGEPEEMALGDITNAVNAVKIQTPPNNPQGLPGNGAGSGNTNALPSCQLAAGYLMLFNDYLDKKKLTVDWQWESSKGVNSNAEPYWEVQIMLDGECVGSGRARNKKAAKNGAAMQALEKLGLLQNI